MTGPGANAQILSIAECHLFSRVSQKAFLDDLLPAQHGVRRAGRSFANPRTTLL
jgi:hypothetical protein